jgi:hypothetical protein
MQQPGVKPAVSFTDFGIPLGCNVSCHMMCHHVDYIHVAEQTPVLNFIRFLVICVYLPNGMDEEF